MDVLNNQENLSCHILVISMLYLKENISIKITENGYITEYSTHHLAGFSKVFIHHCAVFLLTCQAYLSLA